MLDVGFRLILSGRNPYERKWMLIRPKLNNSL